MEKVFYLKFLFPTSSIFLNHDPYRSEVPSAYGVSPEPKGGLQYTIL